MQSVKIERIADGFPKQRMIVLPRPVVKAALSRSITETLLPTDIGQFSSAVSHYVDRRGGVPQAILIYCVRGNGWADVGGVRTLVTAGNVLIIPPGVSHQYGAAERRPWTIYWAHVVGSHVPHLLELLGVRSGSASVIDADSRTIVPLFEEIIVTLAAGYGRPSLVLASTVVAHLFGQLFAQRGTGTEHGDLDERLEMTIEFMKGRIGGAIRVAELAAMSRLSPSHYAVLFKRKTGFAVLDYFIRLKMQEACQLLDMSALPINLVARRLGYDDALYFSRAFHKVMGLPPREYRQLRKG